MSTLEYTVYRIRKGWRTAGTFIFAGAFAAAFVSGIFSETAENPTHAVLASILFGVWAIVFGLKAHARFIAAAPGKPAEIGRTDLELGLLLVVATHAGVQLAGGLDSLLYPIVFVLIAFLVVYTPQWVGFALVAAAIGIEFSLALVHPAQTPLYEVIVHSIFIIFFALINLVFTRTEVARMRRRAKHQVELAKAAMVDEARDFRLTAPASGVSGVLSREEEQARLSRASVSELRSAMYHHVDLLRRTMKLHTCAVLWLDARGERLRVLECVSESESVSTRHLDKGDGAVGAILQSKKPLRLKGLRRGYPGLTYYDRAIAVTDFIGVPIIESGSLRGVLCGDRSDGTVFESIDVETFEASVESLLSIVANERVFTQLQKAKSEQGKLLLASEALTRALTETDVVKAALEAAGQIVTFDIAAVVLIDSNGHQVVMESQGDDSLRGQRVSGTSSLASAALKNRHFLPYRGEFDPRQQTLLSKKTQKTFAKMCSAIILPLIAGDQALGTLTLTSTTPSVFDEEVRTTLQVMTNQLGTALLNAQMVRRLEELATTDGLTGLANHRVFQEEFDKKLASASRFNNELSVILCDLDKFKSVNDTYGHPVGDQVIRGLAATLKRNVVRDTDMPARYGGEEFAILCEGTGARGAAQLAERIREDLERQSFHTDQGELKVTISMGVATFPAQARTKEDLVERADIALYAAKEGGRNQVRTWSKEVTA